MDDYKWMRHALSLARKAEIAGEVPVGAVLVKEDMLIAKGWNCPIQKHDVSAHAEVVALREAGRQLGNYRLTETTLYVTLEPCIMCVGAMIHARIERLVYATPDPRTGAIESAFSLLGSANHNHTIRVSSRVLAAESSALLKAFFKARRK